MLSRVSDLQNDTNTSAHYAGDISNPIKSLVSYVHFVTGEKRKYLALVVIPVFVALIAGLVYAFQSGKQDNDRQLNANLTGQQSASSGDSSNQGNHDKSDRPATGATSDSSSSSNNSSSTSVTINGQAVNVPPNGSYNQTIEHSDGSHTTVSGENSHSSSTTGGSAHNSSSTTVTINSNSGGD